MPRTDKPLKDRRLGRTLAHLVNTVQDLWTRGVGLRVLTGQGAQMDTTTAGLTAARTRGRKGGRTWRWCTDPAPSVSHDRPPGHRGDSRCMISI